MNNSYAAQGNLPGSVNAIGFRQLQFYTTNQQQVHVEKHKVVWVKNYYAARPNVRMKQIISDKTFRKTVADEITLGRFILKNWP